MTESETDFAEATCQPEPDIIDLDDSYGLVEQLDYSDILSDNEDVTALDSEVNEDDSDVNEDSIFDQDDLDAFNRENSKNSSDLIKDSGLNEIQPEGEEASLSSDLSDKIESPSVTSKKEDSSQDSVENVSSLSVKEDSETVNRKYLCLSEDKLLAMKRKEVLKRIKKLPISERFIVHGRNLLPWNQKVLNCSSTFLLSRSLSISVTLEKYFLDIFTQFAFYLHF